MLGIDVGGTFTDFVAYDVRSRQVQAWKSFSVAGDPVTGILRGLEGFAGRDHISSIRLGTTVATNALLERTVAPIAYVTTAGFRDVPFIQRGNRRYHYNMHWVKPQPLVRRRDCFEVTERIDHRGEVVVPLDIAEARDIAQRIAAQPHIRAVAVVLLFSYLNPRHEQQIREIFADVAPHLPVSISYDVLPRWKEYERASTTIADAALKPIVSDQMRLVRDRLRGSGIAAHVSAIRSNGGEMTLDAAAEAPVQLALSGPTGGVVAAQHIAALTGVTSLVTLDIGGTSTDCSTIIDGKVSFTTEFEIEFGLPIQIPMIDIRTIGAGGGSIAWIDKGGMLQVGPQSSRSDPGPACYGKGGVEPTVTDANLLLGRIDPGNFLGGAMVLDRAAAERAVATLAGRLGMSVEQTALAIIRIANNSMEGALRSVLIERGKDPRDFTLLAFGGAGPLHVSDLMRNMGIASGIVPNHPGQLSAYGFNLTEARVDRQRTSQAVSSRYDGDRAFATMRQLMDEVAAELNGQGHAAAPEFACSLEMRYHGQNYELELPVDETLLRRDAGRALWDQFHAAHERRFGFAIPGETVEIINFSVTGIVRTPRPAVTELAVADGPAMPTGMRPVRFTDGEHETPIFARDELRAGHRLAGPALVEESASVTVIGEGHQAEIDRYGNILLSDVRAGGNR
ncbi:MAG: hydantoinase/oxoprolinase family protein [Parvibaculaceae bacterium]